MLTPRLGATVIEAVAIAVQPFASVIVTVYSVEEVGEAIGFEIFGIFNPATGNQAYVAIPNVACKVIVAPEQIVSKYCCWEFIVAFGAGFTVMVVVPEVGQPVMVNE